MRVYTLQENLAKGLSLVSRAVATRSNSPILNNILLDARDNQLRLATTNREIAINCWIGAKVEDEGAITVPARLLNDYVNGLPPERVDLEVAVRTQTLHLRCADFVASIKGLDAYDFPLIPTMAQPSQQDGLVEVVDGERLEVALPLLQRMLEQVIFAAATDESRPVLTGVELRWQGDRLTLAACDNHRLSVHTLHLAYDRGTDVTAIVPARNLGELLRALGDGDGRRPVQIVITQGRNQILFQVWGKSAESQGAFHRLELVSELIEARYPDYRGLVPNAQTTRTIVETAALLKAVRMAALFARDDANRIQLQFTPGTLLADGYILISANSSELGDNTGKVKAQVEGEPLKIAFNAKYLMDVLSRIDQPQIILKTTQPTRPTILQPVGAGGAEFLHVMMPMHVSGE
jgi:DNA polymerase-3 subunit beta